MQSTWAGWAAGSLHHMVQSQQCFEVTHTQCHNPQHMLESLPDS